MTHTLAISIYHKDLSSHTTELHCTAFSIAFFIVPYLTRHIMLTDTIEIVGIVHVTCHIGINELYYQRF